MAVQSLEGAMARWRRLEGYLARLESTSSREMAQDELDEFVHLYRTACSDLAKARSDNPGHNIENYLNDIVARGHKQFRPPVHPGARSIIRFFTVEFPAEVRALKWNLYAAIILFFLPMVFSAVIVYRNPSAAYSLASPEILESMVEAYGEGHSKGRGESEDTFMAGYYISHNVGIAFQCFATGVFFAVGSVFALFINGVILGTIGAFVCAAGHTHNFISFVSGHGSFELTAIVLAGATGIKMGMILVNPGQWTRLAAFKLHAPSILRVVLGAAGMLVVAAFIEGFWSPSSAPYTVKYAVAIALWLLVIMHLGFAGRGPRATSEIQDFGQVKK